MKKDGHIHTPFCPHGSNDAFELYIEKAIAHQFDVITFTEHAPLPKGFEDPTPDKDSGMKMELLNEYIQKLTILKQQYKKDITILIGLEVDYIEGYEHQTTDFLNEYGPYLDDSILSVHFLKHAGQYTCIDFSPEAYMQFCDSIGSAQSMYEAYYETVKRSILAELGQYKPKRIGHPTLIHKFQNCLTVEVDDKNMVKETLLLIKQHGYELDFNSAGLSKQYCLETYPPIEYFSYINEIQLPYVFGSDAHTAKDLHQHYEKIFK